MVRLVEDALEVDSRTWTKFQFQYGAIGGCWWVVNA